jgi:hypothetical protein
MKVRTHLMEAARPILEAMVETVIRVATLFVLGK